MQATLWVLVIWSTVASVFNFWYAEAIARRLDRQVGPEYSGDVNDSPNESS